MSEIISSSNNKETARRRERPLKRLPQILVGCFLTLYALFFAYRAIAAIIYPYPIEYGEGAVLYEVYHITLGDPDYLYKDNAASPYRAAIYTPLFYYASALPVALSGTPAFVGGRVISVVAALVAGFVLYRAARAQVLLVKVGGQEQRIRLGRRTALCAAATPFATAPVYAWGALFKPDMLAVALSLGAVFIIFLYVERGDPRDAPLTIEGFNAAAAAKLGLTASDIAAADYRRYAAYVSQSTWAAIIAGLLCALALFAKQSALAAPLAIFFFLGLRDKRLGLYFAVAFAGLTTTFLVLFQPFTGGQFFTHVVNYNGQSYEVDWLSGALAFLVGTHPILLLFSLIYFFGELRGINFIGQTSALPSVWSIYFIVALVVTFSVGKVGSNLNYYIETLFIASLLSWWLIARLLAARPKLPLGRGTMKRWQLPVAGTALVLMFVQLILLHHLPIVADGANTPGPIKWQQADEVAAQVRQMAVRGPMLVEDSGWLAAQRLPTDLDDSFVFGQLAKDGQWSQQKFLEDIKAGKYKSLMLEIAAPDDATETELEQMVQSGNYAPFPGRFSPEMLALFKQSFKPEKRLGKYLFLTG